MEPLKKIGQNARLAAKYAAKLGTVEKNRALLLCADAIERESRYLIDENKKDMEKTGLENAAFADRLLLTPGRVKGIADGMRGVAGQEDPVNETVSMHMTPSGLNIGKKRVPLGVIGMIYEARPNVTPDAFALCFKSGNACILRGSSEALNSNIAIVDVIHETLKKNGHPAELVQLITDTSHKTAGKFMKMNEYIDVIIPRGRADFIKHVVTNSTIPVIQHGIGNCHIFVDETADFKKSIDIIINAKTQRPSVCNACEKILIHEKIADEFIPLVGEALRNSHVEIRGDERAVKTLDYVKPAAGQDWYEEYLDMIIGVKVVSGIDEAITHINKYGSGLTDAAPTESYTNAERFLDEVDSAAVDVNASTRFTDGA
jgi:glutamate-5-semialdehyde dehydrogenase